MCHNEGVIWIRVSVSTDKNIANKNNLYGTIISYMIRGSIANYYCCMCRALTGNSQNCMLPIDLNHFWTSFACNMFGSILLQYMIREFFKSYNIQDAFLSLVQLHESRIHNHFFHAKSCKHARQLCEREAFWIIDVSELVGAGNLGSWYYTMRTHQHIHILHGSQFFVVCPSTLLYIISFSFAVWSTE